MAEKAAASRPAKKGLHGWKAFLVVFISGTLAAFLVMGVIVGTLRLFVSTVTGEGEAEPPSAGGGAVSEQTGKPHATLPPGKLDVCKRNIRSVPGLSVVRIDDDGDYHDDALNGAEGERVVRDNCDWEMLPEYASAQPWKFNFRYEAVLAVEEGELQDRASRRFDSWLEESKGQFEEIEEEGQAGISDRGYVLYGDKGEGVWSMVALVQVRSATYQVTMDGVADQEGGIPRKAFDNELRKITDYLKITFGSQVPE